jgi:hypothetical protein
MSPAIPYVKSNVPTVNLLSDNSVVLNVRFDGFTADEPVEISGYVTQDTGAYSAFYYETKVPGDHLQTQEADASQTQYTAEVPVTIDPIANLNQENDLVIVAKVAKVWPTVLASGPPDQPETKAALGKRVVKTWKAKDPPKGVNW